MSELEQRARQLGILLEYVSETGEQRRISDDTQRWLVAMLDRKDEAGAAETAPGEGGTRCFLPEFLEHDRCWGLTCQIYALASERNWGIGDYDDLGRLAEIAAQAGADFLGVSPVHALFANQPARASPYGPSSRQFLNVLYIAPDREPEFEDSLDLAAERQRLRKEELVAYREVADCKLAALRNMYRRFRQNGRNGRRTAFATFCSEQGEALAGFATFQALSLVMCAPQGAPLAWRDWPEDLRTVDSGSVRAFAAAHAGEVDFHKWLQWIAFGQLAEARDRALAAGMRIGLYLDLAVGVAADGAAVWSKPALMAAGAHIGSPPDPFNREGQDWGIVPPRPQVLRAQGYAMLREDLEASMRFAGALRLDHAMALQRLFWVPAGKSAAHGGYVSYPFDDMMETVARLSQAFSCLVIGEALGTLPEGFTRRLAERSVQSYEVLFFQRQEDGGFKAPEHYSAHALACVSTHDLPSLRGWWEGCDFHWRHAAGFLDEHELDDARGLRRREAEALFARLNEYGLYETAADAPEALDDDGVEAVHRFLARSPARLVAVQIEDCLGLREQVNIPGDSGVHPNWRRKLPVGLGQLQAHALFARLTGAMRQERPR